MPPKKEPIKKSPAISDSEEAENQADLTRLYNSAENKLEEIIEEIILFKKKLIWLFEKQNQITDVETLLNEIANLTHAVFPSAKKAVVLKLNHREVIYAKKLLVLENIIDKALADFKQQDDLYQKMFRLKIRLLTVRTDLMWFIVCKIKMIRVNENNVELDFLGPPQDLEQDFINLLSYLDKKPHINFIVADKITLEYFFYGVMACFRYMVLNKKEAKNVCLLLLKNLSNFLSPLKHTCFGKKGLIFLVKTLFDRWLVGSEEFPEKEVLNIISLLANPLVDKYLKDNVANKSETDKSDTKIISFTDRVTHGYEVLIMFKVMFKQERDMLLRKIGYKNQAKANLLGTMKQLTVFCKSYLFVIPLDSLESFFTQFNSHKYLVLQEDNPFIATTFASETRFLENFVEFYVKNLMEAFADLDKVLSIFPKKDLLPMLKGLPTEQLMHKLLVDNKLFMDINSDAWLSHCCLLKLKLTLMELIINLNYFAPFLIGVVCAETNQPFELFNEKIAEAKQNIVFFESLDAIKLQIVEQKESSFKKYLKNAAQVKNNKGLTQRLKSEQLSPTVDSKNKSTSPAFFQRKSNNAAAISFSGSVLSGNSQNKRDKLLNHLEPKLNQAYEKIQQNLMGDACAIYRDVLNLVFTEEHAFSLIHAAWGLADCLKAQSHTVIDSAIRKQLIKSAKFSYAQALSFIDRAEVVFIAVESIADELNRYREFIYQELNVYVFEESKQPRACSEPLANQIKYSDKFNYHALSASDFVDKEIEQFFKHLLTAQINCWVIGGFVRDFLLKRKPKDCDVLVFTEQSRLIDLLNKENILFKLIGKTYPIITIKFQTILLELTCIDKPCDSTIFLTQYCDFTINGAYYDVSKSQLVVPVITEDDLKNFKTVAMFKYFNIQERLKADPVLIFRAIYFACKYNFKIDTLLLESFSLYKKLLPNLNLNQKNRIFTAAVKLFVNGFAVKSLNLIKTIGHLIDLDDSSFSMLQLVTITMDNDFQSNKSPNIALFFAALLLNKFEHELVSLSEKVATKDINLYVLMDGVLANCQLGSPVAMFKQSVMQIWCLWLQQKYEQLNQVFAYVMPFELKNCFVFEHFLSVNELLSLENATHRTSLLSMEPLKHIAVHTL